MIMASWTSSPNYLVEDVNFVGGKARGIFMLPRDWVPPFLVLTREFYVRWRQTLSVIDTFANLPLAEQTLLDEFLDRIVPTFCRDDTKVVIRSNSPDETLSSRGSFDSYTAEPSRKTMADSIAKLLTSSGSAVMCVVLQVAIEPGLTGHMSNERRVSHQKNHWLVEELTHGSHEVEQQMIKTSRSQVEGPLLASTASELRNALRRTAGFLTNIGTGRFHCEWIWNGKQVWLVQADEAQSSPCNAIVRSYLSGVEPPVPDFTPQSCLVHFRNVAVDKWKKLRRPRLFHEIGVPYADVFLLSGEQWTKCDLVDRSRLESDFNTMCHYPVVVRCDVADDIPIDETLLPTSPPLTDAKKLANYLDQVARQFEGEQVSPSNWAFLMAFLVPARASAMVHARPRAKRIQVDTLWGFPGGLQYFPYDRWFYYPGTGKTSEDRRYKSHCLLPSDSKWEMYELGDPFDWQSVLNDEEVATMAKWALQIANTLGREIQLMALARIAGQRGSSSCLPWHYTEWLVPKYRKSLRVLPYSPGITVIRSPNDLDGLQQRASGSRDCGLLIRPNSEWHRDTDFLEHAARVAAEHHVPIYFEGSLLGHAYYIMQRAGAMVIPVHNKEPKDDVKVYNKLVRDRIPVIIRQAGGLVRVRRLGRMYAIALLKQKLIEEAFEVWNAADKEIGDELADVLDVVEALQNQVEITQDELQRIRENKRSKRGGFDEMWFLEQTTIDSLRGQPNLQKQFPQLSEKDVVPARRRKAMKQFCVVANKNPRDLLTLEVMLTPPVNALEKHEIVELASELLEVNVEYIGSRLVVRLSRPVPTISQQQRLLFPEMEDGETKHE